MTRFELLQLLVGQARANGFEFRRWYVGKLGLQWKTAFQVPTQTFTRKMPDGTIGTVYRKAYTRRSTREDAWKYHLRELAVAEEPLRYMRRYLRVEDELDEGAEHEVAPAHHPHPAKKAQAQP